MKQHKEPAKPPNANRLDRLGRHRTPGSNLRVIEPVTKTRLGDYPQHKHRHQPPKDSYNANGKDIYEGNNGEG